MKKFLAFVLILTLLLSCLCVGANAQTEGDFEYTVAQGKATITKYVGSATEVIIPSTLGGVPVTTIAGFAFYSTEGAGVASTAVSVHIPESVTTLEYGALYGCNDVTAYTVSSENPSFKVVNGVLFSKDGKTLVRYPAGRTETSYTIPSDVTTIDHYAFANCETLTWVDLPQGVITIGDRGFYSCDGLTAVELPDSVTTIGDAAFVFCSSLASVNIPDSVKTIGESAFQGCVKLTSLVIGNGVTTIGKDAFYDCVGLTTVVIGDGVTTIGGMAFAYCRNIETLTLGKSVTTIEDSAFDYCEKLTSLTLPYGLKTIEKGAFFACDGITSVTIPSTVTTIGTWALSYVHDGCTTPAPMEGFVIKGVAGSAAETYALANEISFEAVSEKPVWTAVGDGNRDSKVDAKDALIVLKMTVTKRMPPYYMGDFNAPNKDLLTEEQIAYYYYGCLTVLDVDHDERPSANDALQILQYAVGKRDSFPRTDLSEIDSLIWEKVSTPTDVTPTDK